MKRSIALAFLLALVPLIASAQNGSPGSPPVQNAQQTNFQNGVAAGKLQRDFRYAYGSFLTDILGATSGYTKLTVSPGGATYVTVAPTTTATMGNVYIYRAGGNDWLGTIYGPPLVTDLTQVTAHGVIENKTAVIGPLPVPSGGTNTSLIECTVAALNNAYPYKTYINPLGQKVPLVNDETLLDTGVCTFKPGTPTVPAADAGYTGIATVAVPSGTTVITSGMITAVAQIALPSDSCNAIAGTNITVSGTCPAQTISVVASPSFSGTLSAAGLASSSLAGGGTLCVHASNTGVLSVAGSDCGSSGGAVTAVTASGNLASSGGSAPNITITASPAFSGVSVSGLTASSCVRTDGSKNLASAGSDCPVKNADNFWSASQSITGVLTADELKSAPAAANASVQLTAPTGFQSTITGDSFGESGLYLNNDASAIPTLTSVGQIYFKTPNGNCGGATVATINGITVGNTAHPGGGITFHTSDDSGSCVDKEPLVLTHDHHVYMPYDEFYAQFNSPGTCTAFVPCGIVQWIFTPGFHNTAGGTNQPNCTAGMIRDDNSTARAWVLNIQTISALQVTYNYTSLNGLASATTLEVWAECHPAAY